MEKVLIEFLKDYIDFIAIKGAYDCRKGLDAGLNVVID